MSKTPLSTIQAARKLVCTVHQLRYLLQEGLVAPVKGPSGTYMWSAADLKKAGNLMKARSRRASAGRKHQK